MITYDIPKMEGESDFVVRVEFNKGRLLAAMYGEIDGVRTDLAVCDVVGSPKNFYSGNSLLPLHEIFDKTNKSYCLVFQQRRTVFGVVIKNGKVLYDATDYLNNVLSFWGSKGEFYGRRETDNYVFSKVYESESLSDLAPIGGFISRLESHVRADLLDDKQPVNFYRMEPFKGTKDYGELHSLIIDGDTFVFDTYLGDSLSLTPLIMSSGGKFNEIAIGGKVRNPHVKDIAKGIDQTIIVVSDGGFLSSQPSSVLFVSNADGKVQRRIEFGEELFCVALSEDKSLAAFGGDGKVIVMDMDW